MHIFEKKYFAHRGYFDHSNGIPENSMPAFKRAIDHEFGIELDVRMTRDGYLVVFHDESLNRMCGVSNRVRDMTFEELQEIRLLGISETIPLFSDVMQMIDGMSPVIVEIKSEGNAATVSEMVAEEMEAYKGAWCIESFDPHVVQWFKKNKPDIIRGQLATKYQKSTSELSFITRFMLSNLMFNFAGRPDFIAYDHKHSCNFSLFLCRKLFSAKTAAWTIRSLEEIKNVNHRFSVFIFEGFDPDIRP